MEDARAERAVTLVVIVIAALIGLSLVTFGPDRGSSATVVMAAPAPIVSSGVSPTSARATPATSEAATTTVAAPTDSGALPQTDEKPVASGARFEAGVRGLWQAIVDDRPELAMPFFFPEGAYAQVKALADPASDYEQRLVAHYEQDIHSLHSQLGTNTTSAQFVGIDVPDGQAVVVQPGEESNKISYWRVYGTRLRYSVDGVTNMFPVTSLISWRGQWYVVHLGDIR